ncbi:hypothetical protein WG922_09945 [Ramlibacter sp. AN1015]|uniref:hypothetical protein n=1 Tax=Ramlibacter sp. AN1015 TaxID=3133428 RepID=UPI0030C33F45
MSVDAILTILAHEGVLTRDDLEALVTEGNLRDVFRSISATTLTTLLSFASAATVGLGVLRYPPEDPTAYADPQAIKLAERQIALVAYFCACLTIAVGTGVAKRIVNSGSLSMKYGAPAPTIRDGKSIPFVDTKRAWFADFIKFWPFALGHGLVGGGVFSTNPDTNGQAYIASSLLSAGATGASITLMQHLLPPDGMRPTWLDASTPQKADDLQRTVRALKKNRCTAIGDYAASLGAGIRDTAKGLFSRPVAQTMADALMVFSCAMLALSLRPIAAVQDDEDDRRKVNIAWAPAIAFSWGLLQRGQAWVAAATPPPLQAAPADRAQARAVAPVQEPDIVEENWA